MNCRVRRGTKIVMLLEIWSMAWPTMLEEFMSTAVQYIDTAMVGSLGTTATAAVGATATINWLIGGTISALGVGFLSFISQSYGAGLRNNAVRASAQSVFITLVIGSLFTVITLSLSNVIPVWLQVNEELRPLASAYFFILYLPMLPRTAMILFGIVLRSVGDTKAPMKVGLCVNILNVVGNLLLIYPARQLPFVVSTFTIPGAGMGVRGAALASAIAYTFGGALMTLKLWNHSEISPRGRKILPEKEILRPCLQTSVPSMLQRFATSLGYVVFASMINSMGEISMAAHTIANTVESGFYIPGYGMMASSATLTGIAIGAGNQEKLRQQSTLIYLLEIGFMMISGGMLFLFANNMMELFSADRRVIALGATVLKMVALSEPFFGLSIVTEGMLQGAGKTKQAFFINISGMWGIRILGTYIALHLMKGTLITAWGFMIGNNLFVCASFILYYCFGEWNPIIKEGKR